MKKNNEIVGILTYEIDDTELVIGRLAVNPKNFRQGIAKALLNHLTKISKVESIKVYTGLFNSPAVQFNLNVGFSESHESMIEGLSIINFTKSIHIKPE